ncbi:CMRF35-like molecule 1 [Pseudorasbora parva]|uniref:CMRF35-like molecule 1 n=1 Tax=Pseudorasbora parva TaxID=51549 RepID=UPI00351E2A61
MKMKAFHVLWIWIFLSEFWDSATDATEIHGYIGKHVNISCFHTWASTNIKYFCRYPCGNRDILVKSDQSPKGRYTLKDYRTGTFTVTITDLQESDSGIYWCGVKRTGRDTYHKVNLKVSKDPSESITTSTQPHKSIQTSTDLRTTTPAALSTTASRTDRYSSPDALILSPSVTANSNTIVSILYYVGGLIIAVILFIVGLVTVHHYRKKTSASTGSVTPVKSNESKDKQEDCVYENKLPNTDMSTEMEPINRTEVPKSQEHSVYANVPRGMGQSHELYGNL